MITRNKSHLKVFERWDTLWTLHSYSDILHDVCVFGVFVNTDPLCSSVDTVMSVCLQIRSFEGVDLVFPRVSPNHTLNKILRP